jgi:flagellar biosynthesis/type III secretory pathway M-ring protein FliF/YscJ
VIPDPIDDFIDAVDWDALSVWLQPLATVITGLFALIAAIFAYRAVTRQIRANAENLQAQIDAAAAQQQKNREAEWAMLRRKEVLAILE